VQGHAVLFGGLEGTMLRDTWFLRGNSWVQGPSAPFNLDARHSHALVYDATEKHMVLFGGAGADLKNDTWFLRGGSWVKGPDAPDALTPRAGHAMVYDAARKRVVLFGGRDSTAKKNDTWFLQGNSWSSGPAAPPLLSARVDHAMAYDAARKRVVLVGGDDGQLKNDTWVLEDDVWMALTSAPPVPTPRAYHAMSYDPIHDRVILFGGLNNVGARLSDTYFLQGNAWTIGPTPPPGFVARIEHAMTFDPVHQRIVMHGGVDSGLNRRTDTYFLEGNSWNPVPLISDERPDPRVHHAMVYDAARARIVLFGGQVADGTGVVFAVKDTWVFEGDNWVRAPDTPGISPRRHHAMAYDRKLERVVLFGGEENSETNDETWVLDDNAWVPGPNAPPKPSARTHHSMAYDRAQDRLILFGGFDSSANYLNDTWILEENGWSPGPSAPLGLSGRKEHAMAYDSRHDRIMMIGGDPELDNSWILQGNTWSADSTTPRELADRQRHAMTELEHSEQIIVFGGTSLNGNIVNDTWIWDGETWVQGPFPFAVADHSMASQPDRGRVVLFGGATDNTSTLNGDTWVFRFEAQGTLEENCHLRVDDDQDGLAGCADPDCWALCTPECPPYRPCSPDARRCGDDSCNPFLESFRNCPEDCPSISECGDFQCTAPETSATCPGDCE
jgi:hypothetical protein